jgi:hypothetical protein
MKPQNNDKSRMKSSAVREVEPGKACIKRVYVYIYIKLYVCENVGLRNQI